MKMKVNPLTGMVAVVAGENIMNRVKDTIFGLPPKDAAKMLSAKHVKLHKDLPDLKDADYEEVDVDLETGNTGPVTGLSTSKEGSGPAEGKSVAEASKK